MKQKNPSFDIIPATASRFRPPSTSFRDDPTSSLPTRDKFIRVDESDALDLSGLGVLGSSDGGVDTLAVLEPRPGRGSSVLPAVDGTGLGRSHTNNLGVDSTRDAVHSSVVELGKGVLLVDGSLLHIPDSGGLNDVGHLDTLDSLVLGDASGTVGAPEEPNVTTTLLSSAGTSSLFGHFVGRLSNLVVRLGR